MRKILAVTVLTLAFMEVIPLPLSSNTSVTPIVPFEAPRIDFDGSQAVPLGYERVTIHTQSPEKAKAFWINATGSLKGYSLEKVNKATLISRIGKGPCACNFEAFPWEYYGPVKGGGSDCRDSCS